mmetsp:Transcript_32392/g.127050  ORF Transcript_32392/g.127050 Transcript_32392/m.127050 type:complete len:84 (+) Transcript_32392:115-366(+)
MLHRNTPSNGNSSHSVKEVSYAWLPTKERDDVRRPGKSDRLVCEFLFYRFWNGDQNDFRTWFWDRRWRDMQLDRSQCFPRDFV